MTTTNGIVYVANKATNYIPYKMLAHLLHMSYNLQLHP